MRYVLIFLMMLGFVGCSGTTSESLYLDAKKACEKEPITEGARYYCAMDYVTQKCKFGLLDLYICGTLEGRR